MHNCLQPVYWQLVSVRVTAKGASVRLRNVRRRAFTQQSGEQMLRLSSSVRQAAYRWREEVGPPPAASNGTGYIYHPGCREQGVAVEMEM